MVVVSLAGPNTAMKDSRAKSTGGISSAAAPVASKYFRREPASRMSMALPIRADSGANSGARGPPAMSATPGRLRWSAAETTSAISRPASAMRPMPRANSRPPSP